jgi:hypothetical protein
MDWKKSSIIFSDVVIFVVPLNFINFGLGVSIDMIISNADKTQTHTKVNIRT